MDLYDLLACPVCKTGIEKKTARLQCGVCGREYPIIKNVPIMFPDWDGSNIEHESELVLRDGYDPWVPRLIMQSFADNQIIVDIGCGNMTLDDPCIIRMDCRLTPHVDVVGDVHCLPFRPNTIDFFFGLAVFEHFRNPFLAAEEIFEVLKPGGYVYGDCCFVFPYHGYPHHYFNASIHGLREVFHNFRQLRLGVPPFQMPSFALESLLTTYANTLPVDNESEREFVSLLRKILEYPLRYYDTKFTPETAYRVSAGGYFTGIKQPSGHETVIPQAIMQAYDAMPALKNRYADPHDLTRPDNLMLWSRTEGVKTVPEIADYYQALEPFCKHSDPARPRDRARFRARPLPCEPDDSRILTPRQIARFRSASKPSASFALRRAGRIFARWIKGAGKGTAGRKATERCRGR
jgi:uncharacterized protein YbaR (Trm112 family)